MGSVPPAVVAAPAVVDPSMCALVLAATTGHRIHSCGALSLLSPLLCVSSIRQNIDRLLSVNVAVYTYEREGSIIFPPVRGEGGGECTYIYIHQTVTDQGFPQLILPTTRQSQFPPPHTHRQAYGH